MKVKLKKPLLIGLTYVAFKWTVIGLFGSYLYHSTYWSNWFFLVIPLFAFIVGFFARKYFLKSKIS